MGDMRPDEIAERDIVPDPQHLYEQSFAKYEWDGVLNQWTKKGLKGVRRDLVHTRGIWHDSGIIEGFVTSTKYPIKECKNGVECRDLLGLTIFRRPFCQKFHPLTDLLKIEHQNITQSMPPNWIQDAIADREKYTQFLTYCYDRMAFIQARNYFRGDRRFPNVIVRCICGFILLDGYAQQDIGPPTTRPVTARGPRLHIPVPTPLPPTPLQPPPPPPTRDMICPPAGACSHYWETGSCPRTFRCGNTHPPRDPSFKLSRRMEDWMSDTPQSIIYQYTSAAGAPEISTPTSHIAVDPYDADLELALTLSRSTMDCKHTPVSASAAATATRVTTRTSTAAPRTRMQEIDQLRDAVDRSLIESLPQPMIWCAQHKQGYLANERGCRYCIEKKSLMMVDKVMAASSATAEPPPPLSPPPPPPPILLPSSQHSASFWLCASCGYRNDISYITNNVCHFCDTSRAV